MDQGGLNEMKACVICKHGIPTANTGREDAKYKQSCSSCGVFKICHEAVLID